jgi:hypothetical protein
MIGLAARSKKSVQTPPNFRKPKIFPRQTRKKFPSSESASTAAARSPLATAAAANRNSECRKGIVSNVPTSAVPNVQPTPNPTPKAAKDVGKDVGPMDDSDEDDSDEFRWDHEDIVVPCQPPIAIYRNPSGGIVIRQDQTAFYDDDHWIVVLPENLPRLIRRLQEIERAGP